MSLNWNIEKCKDFERLKGKDEWAITESIIFHMMTVGIGQIKDDNTAKALARRIRAWENYIGASVTIFDGKQVTDRKITYADCRDRIGMYTNVTSISDSAWKKKLGEMISDRSDREVNEEIRELHRNFAATETEITTK